jgi:hypothetical protein
MLSHRPGMAMKKPAVIIDGGLFSARSRLSRPFWGA